MKIPGSDNEAKYFLPVGSNILINDGWITVSKSAQTNWKSIKPAVERALGDAT